MMENNQNGRERGLTVCFTGHRSIAYEDALRLPALLDRVLTDLIGRGVTTFRAGGAIGFDTVAALKVLEMKERYPHIQLELILPCRNQTEYWGETAVRTYQYILNRADSHRFLFDTYFDGCMLERDRKLVEGSDVCVAFCKRNRGGTAYTFTHAVRAGLEVINLHELM
ncbi:MAG: DUF1273 family protein [Clostridia bacterium]|nr:DUF1273 family protein [Clostridia bacterium]